MLTEHNPYDPPKSTPAQREIVRSIFSHKCCPNCGTPVLRQLTRSFFWTGGKARWTCRNCDAILKPNSRRRRLTFLGFSGLVIGYLVAPKLFGRHDIQFIGSLPFWLKYVPVFIVMWYLDAVVLADPNSPVESSPSQSTS